VGAQGRAQGGMTSSRSRESWEKDSGAMHGKRGKPKENKTKEIEPGFVDKKIRGGQRGERIGLYNKVISKKNRVQIAVGKNCSMAVRPGWTGK